MKIYLIRHGETIGDIEDRFGGDYDDHLSDKGKISAQRLAKKLRGKSIEIIFVSPRIRAKETAEIVQKELNVPLKIIDDLRERNNYGILTGLTKAEAQEKYPLDFEKISKDKTYHHVAGSESYERIKKRAIKVFSEILSKDYKTIAIISHGGIIGTYVREVLTTGKSVKLGDCAILEIHKHNQKLTLYCLDKAEIEA